MIDKSTNTTIYEPGTYNARGQMMHFAMNNKSLYTTFGYDIYGLPPTFKTMLSTAYVIPRFLTRNLRGSTNLINCYGQMAFEPMITAEFFSRH